MWPNQPKQGFTTGINIFHKEEQEKLQERAKRFGLKPTEIHNFTDEELQELHDSLGITADDEKEIRFNALHMRGTDNMSTENVLEYFHKFGPSCIEWINDESCNVLWNDKISAARALFFLSSPIEGMPVEGPCDPFIKDISADDSTTVDPDNVGKSILLRNTDREVELEKEEKENMEGKVHVSDIDVPIPPGYWRLGIKHNKAKFILLRFAVKSDKKPFRAERFSEYYKKHGNPNYGGLKGIITQSRRQKAKGIFDHNPDMNKEDEIIDNKNPWGSLAENWIDEEPEQRQIARQEVVRTIKLNQSTNILSRLGNKRSLPDKDDVDDNTDKHEEKKSKFPRMRMYADEEEEKIKRKKQLMALRNLKKPIVTEKSKDLRDILKIPKKEHVVAESAETVNRRNRRLREDDGSFPISKMRSDEEEINREKRQQKSRIESARFKSERSSSDRYRESKSYRVNEEDNNVEEYDSTKPKSKVAVVIKARQQPTVASTVWSRINKLSDRLKTVPEEKLRERRNSTSSESSTTSSADSSNTERSETNNENNVHINRPGFRSKSPQQHTSILKKEPKSPLRIEISNDHFKNE